MEPVFKNFEVVASEAKDHRYINNHKQCSNNNSNIMKEWKILQDSLPESIYVQAYETRIDLLRAVLIGPPGTPYHDGLFLFDIVLPSDYPQSPPNVYYHSHGYRLNPNLYANGYVCLSLINTWKGSDVEKWRESSTILQLLVSIQGLVLNEWPYYNEPGYKYNPESNNFDWIYNESLNYNEEAFILSCKTMLQIIRQPPTNFEDFVVGHFRKRATAILAAVEHYQQAGNVVVGHDHQPQMKAASSSSSARDSSKFKARLVEIKGLLEAAFASIALKPNKHDNASLEEEEA